jgi:uncharacterized membrane protein YdjX (TVP38/TMEM64 family)
VFSVLLLGLILVRFVALEAELDALVRQTLASSQTLLLITLAVIVFLLADIVPPIPSNFVLATTGYQLGTVLGTAVNFTGLGCACLAGYALGRAAGRLPHSIVGSTQLERCHSDAPHGGAHVHGRVRASGVSLAGRADAGRSAVRGRRAAVCRHARAPSVSAVA